MKLTIDIPYEAYYTFKCDLGKGNLNALGEIVAKGTPYEERPQGKWVECTKSGMPLTEYGRMTGEKWYGFKCSQCNFIYKGNALIESPYCQKCGASMLRGEKND